MSLAFLFPGQGSQRVGMGADVFELFPELVAEADAVLAIPFPLSAWKARKTASGKPNSLSLPFMSYLT